MASDTAQNTQISERHAASSSGAARGKSSGKGEGADSLNDGQVHVAAPRVKLDFATILGLIFANGLVVGAVLSGAGNANFFNIPALMIVLLGTMATTSVSYTGNELKHVPGILGNTIVRWIRKPSTMALQLLDIASIARRKGILALSGMESELAKDPFLAHAMQLVTDGYSAEDIEHVLGAEIDSLVERHRHSASILRRASEVAPAMGLIGTLVGLVQMLAQLEDPSSIGPSMAVALLTTFYGAIMGTVVLGPLAAKLERNSNDEATLKSMIMAAMMSIVRQENPRRLEMQLNSMVLPEDRIEYFKK